MRRMTIVLAAVLLAGPVLALPPQSPTSPPPGDDAEYRIGPNDRLQIWLWQEPELGASVSVRPDGRISLPLINEVEVSGKTPAQVQRELTSRYSDFIGAPILSVIVTEINSPQISILGRVRSPGRYPLRERLTILDAIAIAGGFADFADRDEVMVIRMLPTGVERIRVNFSRLLDGRDEVPLIMQPSDLIYVK